MSHQQLFHILIIDQLSPQVERLIELLKASSYKVSQLDDVSNAMDFCVSSRPDMLIANLDGRKDEVEFIRQAKNHYATHTSPIIVTTETADYRKRIEYTELDIDDLIQKPYYAEEVVARIANIFQEYKSPVHLSNSIDRGFVGNLGEMDLIDLLQTMEMGHKSGIIHLSRGDKEGKVVVHKGKLVDAIVEGISSARKAFLHMLTWVEGSFYVVFQEVPEKQPVAEDHKSLLEQAQVIVEKWQAVTRELPSLHTYLKAVSDKAPHPLGHEKVLMLSTFKEPRTILQAIDQAGFDDIEGLEIIKSLLEEGLLIEVLAREEDEKPAAAILPARKVNGEKRFKNRYSHIFSLFQRRKQNAGNSTLTLSSNGIQGLSEKPVAERKITNHIRLTKAELLLIRQKLSS